jgi:hypothetical protein
MRYSDRRQKQSYDLDYKRRIVGESSSGTITPNALIGQKAVRGQIYTWRVLLENCDRQERIAEFVALCRPAPTGRVSSLT